MEPADPPRRLLGESSAGWRRLGRGCFVQGRARAAPASLANDVWNACVPAWNQKTERAGKKRARRSPYGAAMPEIAPHLALGGQIRPVTDPHSTLYNTDGQ